MTKPLLIFVGRVTKLANVTPKQGKPYLSVKIEGPAETFNGKEFRSRVEAKVYYGAEELAKTLREGMMVSCHGNARAEHFEWSGKHYASLVCERAAVTVLEQDGELPLPTAARGETARKATPVSAIAKDDDDDVPFKRMLKALFGLRVVRT